MKKLNNDPSRNVNAVSGMWVRLRKDDSKYDVRYVNAKVKRIWRLSETSAGTSWNVQAKGEKKYAELLGGMKASQTDLEHGWFLIPDGERKAYGFTVPVLTGMDAKSVSGITVADFESRWTCEGERFATVDHWPEQGMVRYLPSVEEAAEDDEPVPEFSDDEPSADDWAEYYESLADVYTADMEEPAPITQEIAEVPPKTNELAVSYATLPDLMMAKECPELQGLGHIRHFRTSKGRKVAYVASANGRCVVAYRARYERGSDRQLEKAVADYVATVRDKWVKAA